MNYEQLFDEHSRIIRTEIENIHSDLAKRYTNQTDHHIKDQFTKCIISKQKELSRTQLKDESGIYSAPNYYIEAVCQDFYVEYSDSTPYPKYKTNKVTQFIQHDLPELQKEIQSRLNNNGTDPYREAIRNSLRQIPNVNFNNI